MSHPAGVVAGTARNPGLSPGRGVFALADRAIGWLVRGAMIASGLSVAVIVVLGVADVVGRVLFDAPVMGTVEITEALLATTIFLALAYALEQHQHIVVDVVTQGLGPKWRLALHSLAVFAMFAVLALLTWQGVLSAERAWQAKEVAAGYIPVPVWLAKALAAAGLGIAMLEAMRQLVWLAWRRDREAGRVRASHAEDAEVEGQP